MKRQLSILSNGLTYPHVIDYYQKVLFCRPNNNGFNSYFLRNLHESKLAVMESLLQEIQVVMTSG